MDLDSAGQLAATLCEGVIEIEALRGAERN
jgi:hypothetical protein